MRRAPLLFETSPSRDKEPLIAYSILDAVRASGLSRATLYREIAAGRLKVRKCGKRTVVLASELEDFLRALPVA